MIRHTISQCKYLYNNHNASKEVAKKQKVENKNFEKLHSNLDKGKVHKGKTLPPDDTMQHPSLNRLNNTRLQKLNLNQFYNI